MTGVIAAENSAFAIRGSQTKTYLYRKVILNYNNISQYYCIFKLKKFPFQNLTDPKLLNGSVKLIQMEKCCS